MFNKASELANAKQLEEAAAAKLIADEKKKEQDAIEAKKPKVTDLLDDIKKLLEKKLK